jgi:hypothetical protein
VTQTFLSPLSSTVTAPARARAVRWRAGRITGYGLALGVSLGAWAAFGLLVSRLA